MAEETTPAVKSGPKTTEFWLSLAAALVGVLLMGGVFTPDGGCVDSWCTVAQTVTGAVVTLLAAMGYQWTRSRLKAAATATPSG